MADVAVAVGRRVPESTNVTARFTMRPSDILLLPYGLGHHCHTPATGSLHLLLTFERLHGYRYLKWLLEKAEAQAPLRRPAPFGRDAESLSRYVAGVTADVADLMGSYSVERFLDEQRARTATPITLADLPKATSPNSGG